MNSYSIIVLAIIVPFLFLLIVQNKKIEHFGFITEIKNTVTNWVNDKIVNPAKNTITDIKNLGTNIGNKVVDTGGDFISSITDGVMKVKNKFLNIFEGLKGKLGEFITRFKNSFQSFVGDKFDTLKEFIKEKVDTIKEIKDYISEKIKEQWGVIQRSIMQSVQYIFYGLLVLNAISLFGCVFNFIKYFFPKGCPTCSCQSC